MTEYSFKPSELKFLWKKRGNQNYQFRHFLGGDHYPKLILFHDVAKNREVLGKIVELPAEGEAYHWARLHHENLLPLYDMVSINENARIFITPVLEKSLRDIIYEVGFLQDPKCFDRKKAYVEDVLWGLDYIHRKSLCLVNLNDTKILICNKSDKAVISDFSGLMQVQRVNKSNFVLPPAYRAPELVDDDSDELDPVATEMWACGVMIMQIFTQHMLPWATSATDVSTLVTHSSWNMEKDAIRRANVGTELKSEDILGLKGFLEEFLRINSRERTSAGKAAISEFLQCSNYRLDKKARDFWCSYEPNLKTLKTTFLKNIESNDFDSKSQMTRNSEHSKEEQEPTNKFINLHYVNNSPGAHRCIDEDYMAIWKNNTSEKIIYGKESEKKECLEISDFNEEKNSIVPEKRCDDIILTQDEIELPAYYIDLNESGEDLHTQSNMLNVDSVIIEEIYNERFQNQSLENEIINSDTETEQQNDNYESFLQFSGVEDEETSSTETLSPITPENTFSSQSKLSLEFYPSRCDETILADEDKECLLDSSLHFLKFPRSYNIRLNSTKSESEVDSKTQKLSQLSFSSLRSLSKTDNFMIKFESECQLNKDYDSVIKAFSDNFCTNSILETKSTALPDSPIISIQADLHIDAMQDGLTTLETLEKNDSAHDNNLQNMLQENKISEKSEHNVLKFSFSTPEQRFEWDQTDALKQTLKCSNCDKLKFLSFRDNILPCLKVTSPKPMTKRWDNLKSVKIVENTNKLYESIFRKRNASYAKAVVNGMESGRDVCNAVQYVLPMDDVEVNSEINTELNYNLLQEVGSTLNEWQDVNVEQVTTKTKNSLLEACEKLKKINTDRKNNSIFDAVQYVPSIDSIGDNSTINDEEEFNLSQGVRQLLNERQPANGGKVTAKPTNSVHESCEKLKAIKSAKKSNSIFRFKRKESTKAKNRKTYKDRDASKTVRSGNNAITKTNLLKNELIPDSSIEVSMEIPLCTAMTARNCLGFRKNADLQRKKPSSAISCSWFRSLCPGSKNEKCESDEKFIEIPLHQL